MIDIIKILPDSVANQIAAGEVVQRPASVVKELLENSIDSGADEISLIVKDSGKTLIQVVDNGKGMSVTDARLCFERHATSKINDAHDLFKLATFGFRGEALASIAAVAQVELKSKRRTDELGTEIIIEGSEVKSQTPCSSPDGTSISVKNIFFNIPARRNFLKSDATELSYIIDELHRVALVYHDIAFEFYHQNKLILKLDKSSRRMRLNQIFGNNFGEKILSVDEKTSIVEISGFIGKPEFAKKTRGEQFVFVNNRYIRHPYLNHAIEKTYTDFIPQNTFPSYFIFLSVDPAIIDVNIHPTKTEVKFMDEKTLYGILKASIRKSFGSFHVTPALDFEIERSLDFGDLPDNVPIKIPTVNVNPSFNPFETRSPGSSSGGFASSRDKNAENWEALYEIGKMASSASGSTSMDREIFPESNNIQDSGQCLLFNRKYIVTPVKSGLMIVDVVNARERIFYDKYLNYFSNQKGVGQRLLFPVTFNTTASDAELITELLPELRKMGFDMDSFGNQAFVVNAMPSDIGSEEIFELIELVIDSFRRNMMDTSVEKSENLAKALAKNTAGRNLKLMSQDEMQSLIGELFKSPQPEYTPSGKKIISIIPLEDFEKKFR
jgi:DNA mismatch repair protein MutL